MFVLRAAQPCLIDVTLIDVTWSCCCWCEICNPFDKEDDMCKAINVRHELVTTDLNIGFVAALMTWLWYSYHARAELAAQRRALQMMEDWQLDDLGLTRDQAQAEAKQPVWFAPLPGKRTRQSALVRHRCSRKM